MAATPKAKSKSKTDKEATEKTPKPTLKHIPLADIDPDPAAGVRADTDDAVVAEYAAADRETPGCLPPVDVYRGPEKSYLADGGNRLAALHANGRETIPAAVRTYKTDDEARLAAVLHACGANASHGRRRSDADKREAVRQYLTTGEWAERSDRRAEADCKVNYTVVRDVRADLTRAGTLTGSKRSAERYADWDKEAGDWKDGRAARGSKLVPAATEPPARAPDPEPAAVIPDPAEPADAPAPDAEPAPPAEDAPPARAPEAVPAPEPSGPGRPIDVLGDLPDDVARALRVNSVTTVGQLADKLNRPGTLRELTADQRADLSRRLRELDAPAGRGSDGADAMTVALDAAKELDRLVEKVEAAANRLARGPLGASFGKACKAAGCPLNKIVVKEKGTGTNPRFAQDRETVYVWPAARLLTKAVAEMRAKLKPADAHDDVPAPSLHAAEAA